MLLNLYFNLGFVLLFSFFIYSFTNKNDWNLNRDLTLFESIYVTLSSVSTVGYGDINATSDKSRVLLTVIQAILLIELVCLVTSDSVTNLLYRICYLYLFIFSLVAVFMFATSPSDWKFPLESDTNNLINMMYFTHTSITTCGYGDITPHSVFTRCMCMILKILIIFNLFSI